MKLTTLLVQAIGGIGKACRKIKLSQNYDVSGELFSDGEEQPRFFWHVKGVYTVKILKWALSFAMVCAALSLYRSQRKREGKFKRR